MTWSCLQLVNKFYLKGNVHFKIQEIMLKIRFVYVFVKESFYIRNYYMALSHEDWELQNSRI